MLSVMSAMGRRARKPAGGDGNGADRAPRCERSISAQYERPTPGPRRARSGRGAGVRPGAIEASAAPASVGRSSSAGAVEFHPKRHSAPHGLVGTRVTWIASGTVGTRQSSRQTPSARPVDRTRITTGSRPRRWRVRTGLALLLAPAVPLLVRGGSAYGSRPRSRFCRFYVKKLMGESFSSPGRGGCRSHQMWRTR